MTTADLIKSAKREFAMRKNVYPRKVDQGRMKQAQADHEIACMNEIVNTLERLEATSCDTFSTLYDFLNERDAPYDIYQALEKLELAIKGTYESI
jgi:hypothetical protein